MDAAKSLILYIWNMGIRILMSQSAARNPRSNLRHRLLGPRANGRGQTRTTPHHQRPGDEGQPAAGVCEQTGHQGRYVEILVTLFPLKYGHKILTGYCSAALKPQEVTEALQLSKLKDKIWYVVPSCATTGEGLLEGLAWLSNNVKAPPTPAKK